MSQDHEQKSILLPVMLEIPEEKQVDFVNIWKQYPNLPLSAHLAILEYGKCSDEEFSTKVPAAWSSRVDRLAAKLNADAELAPLEADIDRTLRANTTLADLWLMIVAFLSEGEEAASYFFVALQAAAKSGEGTVPRLNIPAPSEFWKVPDWRQPKSVMSLMLMLVVGEPHVEETMTMLSRTSGIPDPSFQMMESGASADVVDAYEVAKSQANIMGKTTIFAVDLNDKGLKRVEDDPKNRESIKFYLSFRRMFVLGVCTQGLKIWHAGGIGFGDSFRDRFESLGPEVLAEQEAKDFMKDFERLAGSVGRWNAKRFRWYQRCFGIDLKALEKQEGKHLVTRCEPWVQLYRVDDVKRENITKFRWN